MLEALSVLALLGLVALEPKSRFLAWRARCRPVGDVDEHREFLDALGETVQ